MKEKLTISEMAKLRGITSETLRHYDRIGLFKPQFVNPDTGYRYYSIFQYEVLGTIKELRQLQMTTDEVKEYLDERNFNKSLDILKGKHEELVIKLNELTELEESIREKIIYLEQVEKESNLRQVVFKKMRARQLLTLHEKVNNNFELCYGILNLENMLTEKTPILASNRLGIIIEKSNFTSGRFEEPSTIFIVEKNTRKTPNAYQKKIPEGLFACIRYNGELLSSRAESLKEILRYLENNDYQITGDALQIMHRDITITDNPNEITFEIQVPVQKV